MDNERFWFIVNNQRKWAQEYREKQTIRKEIRKIINRKQKGKGGDILKANILKDLQTSLYANEITIVENPSGKEFEVRFLGEVHSIPALNIQESK